MKADYFDGRTARRREVDLQVNDGRLDVVADSSVLRSEPLHALRILPRLSGAPRRIEFPDGAAALCADHDALDLALDRRTPQTLAHRLESHLAFVVLALAGVIAFVTWGYFRGVPWVADQVARRTPPAVETDIGRAALKSLDQIVFRPTTLDKKRREEIGALFAALVRASRYLGEVSLEHRAGGWVRANALALPGGTVVLTDELVAAMPSDDALAAVLAHELGHIHHRHNLRRILQDSLTALASMAVFGDASGVAGLASAAPTLVINSGYSRDFERESDRFAFDLLKQTGRSPAAFADAMESLMAAAQWISGKEPGGAPADIGKGAQKRRITDYLSTHPDTDERIAAARAAAGMAGNPPR